MLTVNVLVSSIDEKRQANEQDAPEDLGSACNNCIRICGELVVKDPLIPGTYCMEYVSKSLFILKQKF